MDGDESEAEHAPGYDARERDGNSMPARTVYWATKKDTLGIRKERLSYMAYGNESTMALAYCSPCLIVTIEELSRRVPNL